MRKRPLSVGCLVVVILICIVTSLSRKEPWSCPELEGQTVIVQGRVYQKEVKTQGGQDKTVVYLKQVSFTGDNPVEGQSEEGQSVVQEEAAEGQLLVQEKAAERQLLVQEEAAEKQLLVQGKCAEKPADTKATENILCYLREGVPEPEIGSLVILKGTLKNFQQPTNPGQFNAPFYYQILRISFRLNQAEIQVKSDRFYKISEGLYQLRRKAGSKVDALLPEQEASVMKTMLLGEKGILDEEIKDLYQRNGIAHILAISGLHISMIGMGLYQLLRRAGLKIKLSAILASMIIVLYGMMTGFAVSAIRAIAMFLLQMLAQILGRTYDRITALAVAAVLVLEEQPLYLFHSGFQFSFLCVLGISLILPVLGKVRKGKKLSGSLLSDSGLFDVLKFHCTSHDEYFNGCRNCDDSCSLPVHAACYPCGMADYRDPYGIRKAWTVYRAAASPLLDAGLSCKMAAGSICGDTDYYCSSGEDEA